MTHPSPLISIIGPVGVGKTTLATLLGAQLPARLILEDYAGNPFLGDSYRGRPGARLPAQLYFLMSRAGQLSRHAWPTDGLAVSDYGFCQDAIFASMSLDSAEHAIYSRIAAEIASAVVAPSVLISLSASTQTLLDRIACRGRAFEQGIGRRFLDEVAQRCQEACDQAGCPVLRIDCDSIDFRQAPHLAELVRRISEMLGALQNARPSCRA